MKKNAIVFGIIMILVGAVWILLQLNPGLREWIDWPMIILAVGALFMIASLVSRVGDLAIPGAINMGLGGILLYQNYSGRWDTWSFLWTLIPGFIGVGILLANLINRTKIDRTGVALVVASAVVFAIIYLGALFRVGSEILWPAIIMLVGVLILVRAVFRK